MATSPRRPTTTLDVQPKASSKNVETIPKAKVKRTLEARAARSWSAPCRSRTARSSRDLLKKRGIKHQVLNAKHHEREAEIVAQAGRLSAVTIATNMAGRGTDIILGGNPETMAWASCKTSTRRGSTSHARNGTP